MSPLCKLHSLQPNSKGNFVVLQETTGRKPFFCNLNPKLAFFRMRRSGQWRQMQNVVSNAPFTYLNIFFCNFILCFGKLLTYGWRCVSPVAMFEMNLHLLQLGSFPAHWTPLVPHSWASEQMIMVTILLDLVNPCWTFTYFHIGIMYLNQIMRFVLDPSVTGKAPWRASPRCITAHPFLESGQLWSSKSWRRPVLHPKCLSSLPLQEIEFTLAVPAAQGHVYRHLCHIHMWYLSPAPFSADTKKHTNSRFLHKKNTKF